MKVIIAGSRDFSDKKYLFNKLDEIRKSYNINEIVSGTAKGADSIGEQYAFENNIKLLEMPADWRLYGKSAGMKRNREMADYADMAIIFWDGSSPGTRNMIDIMKKRKKPCIVINYNESDFFKEW